MVTLLDSTKIQVPLWATFVFIPAHTVPETTAPLDQAQTGSQAAEQHSASGQFSK